MIKRISLNTIRFVLLILFQVLILNNVLLFDKLNPFLYVLFILMLPFEIPGWSLLLLAFLSGLTVDIFSNTFGLHTIATLAMAFSRPFILRLLAPRDGYENGTLPCVRDFGFWWFTRYTAILVVIHHFVLYLFETGNFHNFFLTLVTIIEGSVITSVLIVITQLFHKRE